MSFSPDVLNACCNKQDLSLHVQRTVFVPSACSYRLVRLIATRLILAASASTEISFRTLKVSQLT